jgi:formylglycine-generating enzyme required for sulfatase activity
LLLILSAPSLAQSPSPPAPVDVAVNSIDLRMILVPAGSFVMGSPAGAPMRQDEETTRRVTLTKALRIGATEVTQRQWSALMPVNRSAQAGDDLPVTGVTFAEATEFCAKLSRKEGVTYRLPTEAEWEYACRAGGEEKALSRAELADLAWHAGNSEGGAHPVGTKAANAWGLHDVLGNVAEWTADAYGPYPRVAEETDPRGPQTGQGRVVRGGSWRSLPPALRCAARVSTPAAYQLPHVGFRVVREVP